MGSYYSQNRLIRYIEEKDIEGVIACVEDGVSLQSVKNRYWLPLNQCVESEFPEAARVLLEHGSPITIDGKTDLHYLSPVAQIFDLVTSDMIANRQKRGRSIAGLRCTINKELVRVFLDAGVSFDEPLQPHEGPRAPIHKAVETGDLEAVTLLGQSGVDLNAKSSSRADDALTPLELAVVVRTSYVKDDIDEKVDECIALFEALLSLGADISHCNNDPLYSAGMRGTPKLIEYLIAKGCNPSPADPAKSYLTRALSLNNEALIEYGFERNIPCDESTMHWSLYVLGKKKNDIAAIAKHGEAHLPYMESTDREFFADVAEAYLQLGDQEGLERILEKSKKAKPDPNDDDIQKWRIADCRTGLLYLKGEYQAVIDEFMSGKEDYWDIGWVYVAKAFEQMGVTRPELYALAPVAMKMKNCSRHWYHYMARHASEDHDLDLGLAYLTRLRVGHTYSDEIRQLQGIDWLLDQLEVQALLSEAEVEDPRDSEAFTILPQLPGWARRGGFYPLFRDFESDRVLPQAYVDAFISFVSQDINAVQAYWTQVLEEWEANHLSAYLDNPDAARINFCVKMPKRNKAFDSSVSCEVSTLGRYWHVNEHTEDTGEKLFSPKMDIDIGQWFQPFIQVQSVIEKEKTNASLYWMFFQTFANWLIAPTSQWLASQPLRDQLGDRGITVYFDENEYRLGQYLPTAK